MCYSGKRIFFLRKKNYNDIFKLIISGKPGEKLKDMKERESYLQMKVF